MAGMFLGLFERHPDAKNYIEMTFSSRLGPVLVTVVKPGGKTPHALRDEAERQLADLRRKYAALQAESPQEQPT